MARLAKDFIPVLFHLLLCVHWSLELSLGNSQITICTYIFRGGDERRCSFLQQAPISYSACNKATQRQWRLPGTMDARRHLHSFGSSGLRTVVSDQSQKERILST